MRAGSIPPFAASAIPSFHASSVPPDPRQDSLGALDDLEERGRIGEHGDGEVGLADDLGGRGGDPRTGDVRATSSARARVRFQRARRWPWRPSERAMPAPIVPRPRTATRNGSATGRLLDIG
jgi:hypothetical protein